MRTSVSVAPFAEVKASATAAVRTVRRTGAALPRTAVRDTRALAGATTGAAAARVKADIFCVKREVLVTARRALRQMRRRGGGPIELIGYPG
jgi:hypothetical protein